MISLIGEGATLLTNDTPGDQGDAGGTSMLHAQGFWQDATVCGLTFQSRHGPTHAQTGALFLEGTNGNGIKKARDRGRSLGA